MKESIVSKGELILGSVDPDSISTVQNLCVYFLIDGDVIVYIGRTGSLRKRLQGHKDKQFNRVYWVQTDESSTVRVEAENIGHYKPALNKAIPFIKGARKPVKQNKPRVNVTVDAGVLSEFKARAEYEGRSLSNLMEIAYAEYLGNRSGEKWKAVK